MGKMAAMANRPNILLFMTDQQRAHSIGAFGSPWAQTPHWDALAAQGIRFEQAYSQHSACSQSRISMMTGRYPHVLGHRTLDHLLKPHEQNLLSILRGTGYHVAWAGIRGDTFAPGGTAAATDFFGFLVKPSLEAVAESHREVFPPGHPFRHAHYRGQIPRDIGPDFDEAAVQTATTLLDQGLPEPFVLVVTLFAPHPPFATTDPWFSLHDRSDMPSPIQPQPRKPQFMAALRERSGLDRLDHDDWAEIAATYAGMVSRVDDHLGRIMAALEQAGAGNRTVTVLFTDHGEYLGDFGLVEKWPSGLDDCLVRSPLVIAGPGVREGEVCSGMVEMVDILPTLCELAEVEVSHSQFGRSLVPLLSGGTDQHREAAFTEGGFRLDEAPQNELLAAYPYDIKTSLMREEPELVGRAAAVRTTNWTYVYRTYELDELYDRRADPFELSNLAEVTQYTDVRNEMRDRLLQWLVETSDVIPDGRDPRMESALVDQFLSA
jgi:arylsulfatase A-like enzyme